MRSPAPETFSPILSVVDFCESGVTGERQWLVGDNEAVVLTLLRRLLAETLAEVIRHGDYGLVGWFS